MKTPIILALTCFFAAICCHAQDNTQAGFVTLINTVPKSSGFKCFITNGKETNILVSPEGSPGDSAGNGFATGSVPWLPVDGDLVAEVPGRAPERLKPFLKPGETSLLVLQAKTSGSLEFSGLPKPANRNGGFYDAVNYTSQPDLQIMVDGKKMTLSKGKRVRLSDAKTMKYEVAGGPGDLLESIDPPSHVMVLYAGDDGKVRCMVVADYSQ